MIRAVADTNVSISAFVFGGLPRTLFRLAAAGRFRLVISEILLNELEEKLRDKFYWPAERVDQTREVMMSLCEMVSPAQRLQVVHADPDDDRVLECAVAGRAGYIVTGDRHLLSLVAYNDIPILNVRQFMERLTPPS